MRTRSRAAKSAQETPARTPPPGQATRWPSEIKIGERHRRDLGDLEALAAEIDAVGLLHPIVIDPQNRLIAGERRLRAWQLSKHAAEPIPVRIVELDDLVRGEWSENTARKDFTPSECVAIKRALEPRFAAAAKERQRAHGGTAPGRKAHSGEIPRGRAADQVARIVGRDRRTLEKAEKIVEAAERDPGRYGKLLEDMDRTGRVDAPYRRLQVMQQAESIRRSPPPLPMRGPYRVVVIDFPWPHEPDAEQDEIDARGRSLRPYAAMSIKAGAHFMREHVRPILAEDCVVWFWTTNYHMPYAFHLLAALGFRRHSTILTWVKDKMGRGQVLRDRTEHAIVAKRGKPLIFLTNETTVLNAPRREHSRKPAEFFALVERVTPALRYASLFSRGGEGVLWDCHGDEVGKFAPHVAAEGAAQAEAAEPGPATSGLPSDIDALIADYRATLERRHMAVLAGDREAARSETIRLDLLESEANGGTHVRAWCADSPAERLRRETAALIGEVPMWGQRGIFRMVIDDVPYLVEHRERCGFTVYAEDAQKPFLSPTGYRGLTGSGVTEWVAVNTTVIFGMGVDAAAERLVRENLATEMGVRRGRGRPRRRELPRPARIYRLPRSWDEAQEPVEVPQAPDTSMTEAAA